MAHDPVVILSARRTPIGAMLGAFASVAGHALGAQAMRGALESAGLDPARLGEVVMGCVLAGRTGPGARAAGRNRRRRTQVRAGHDRQQDVRLRHARRHVRRGPHRRGQRGFRARRRARVDDQRALPAAQGARRLPHGTRRSPRPHVLRRPAESLGRQADGLLRRCDRGQVRVLARRPGCVCRRVRAPRHRRRRIRRLRGRDCAGADRGPQGRAHRGSRRDAVHRVAREDPDPEAGLRQGRHRHRGVLLVDRRRRRRPRARARRRRHQSAVSSRSRASSRTRATRRSRSGSRSRPSARSRPCSRVRAGRLRTSTCSRSTKRSPSSRWRR